MTSTRLLAAILALAVAIASAASAGDGEPPLFRLLGSDGKPVPHARVSVVGRSGAVTTDDDGRFVLRPEPAPPFDLAVFDSGGVWLGQLRIEQLATEGERNIYLPPMEKVEVSVRGGVAPSTLAPPAAASTVVSREDTEQRRPPKLVDVVKQIPGAANVGQGQAAVPSLRGLARGRTLMLVDDGRVTTERRAGPSATFLDPFVLESVEVVRGPGSVVYGSDAIGGIIHGRTPVPTADRLRSRFEIAAGTGENMVAGAVEANIPVGASAMLVAAHARDFDDYDGPDGEVENSRGDDRGFLIKGMMPGVSSRWTLGLQVDRAEDVGKPRLDSTGAETFYPSEESDRLTAAAELPTAAGFSAFDLTMFVGRYRLVTDRTEGLPGGEETFRSDVEANDASIRFVGTHPLDRGSFRVGVDTRARFDLSANNIRIERDDTGAVVDRDSEKTIRSARQIDTGVFAEGERVFRAGRSSLAGGLRGTYISSKNSGGTAGSSSESETTVSGYLAYTFRPADAWSAVFQIARGFREPFLSDRYFDGVTGRGFIEGNPDLVPETTRQLDVSVQRTGAISRLGVYGYWYRIDDLIERFRQADGTFTFRNRGEQEILGIEVESNIELGSKLSVRLTAGWARGEILDDGSNAADIPPLSGAVSVRHSPARNWWWQATWSIFAEDDRPGEGEAVVPSYSVFDASLGWRFAKGLEARLVLGNLFDEEYPASPDDDSVDAVGRNAALVLAGRF